MNKSDITGLIFAGGRGARMHDVDKGLVLLHQKPMALHVVERLAPQVGTLMISANRNLDVYRRFGAPVLADTMSDFAGPLAGLHTCLTHCGTTYLVTAPCDSPLLSSKLVERLFQGMEIAGADAAFAVTGENNRRQRHPVFCLVKATLLPNLTRFLQDGNRKFDTWCATLQSVEVHFADEAAFCNINTPADLLLHERRQVTFADTDF